MKNQNFTRSIRCLQHPAVVLSIVILILNDHLLKSLYPSWVTGKLSDFAGIFYFPFIITAVFSVLLSKFKLTIKQLGAFSFSFVAVCFFLLKTSFSVNLITTDIASLIVGHPTRFVLDPSDIISLLMLIPAWRLWNQINNKRNSFFGYTIFLIGSLAAMATTPAIRVVKEVTNLEYFKNGIVYAADTNEKNNKINYAIAISLDAGLTWNEEFEVRNIEERGLPIKHCSSLYPDICYKVSKYGVLQELSSDYEWVRTNLLDGNSNRKGFIKVLDIVIFEWEEKEYVIVAVGKHGIMRQELPYGNWEEITVIEADE